MNKLIQSFPAHIVKAEANDDQGLVEAYVAVMGNLDHHADVITNGAFKKTIQERSHKIRVLDNHNAYSTEDAIAKLLTIQEVTRDQLPPAMIAANPNITGALFVSFQFMLGEPTDKSARIFQRIKAGVIDEYSIGFEIIQKEFKDVETEAGIRTIRFITEIKLYEFSPVIFAANSETVTVGVKSEDLDLDPDSPAPSQSKAAGMCKGCKMYGAVTESAGYCKMHEMAVESNYGCDDYQAKDIAMTMRVTMRESMQAFFAEQVAAYSELGIIDDTDAERMATLSGVLIDTVLNLMPDDLLGRELPSAILQLPKRNELDSDPEAEPSKNNSLTSVDAPVPATHTDDAQRRIAEIQRLKRISEIKSKRR